MVKVAAAAAQPIGLPNSDGFLSMNVDIGNRVVGGADAISIGDPG